MKVIQLFKLATGALLVAASFHTHAQDASATAVGENGTTTAAGQQYKSAKAANRALARRVRAALAKDKGVSVANITIRAKGGNVVIQGAVPEQSQIDRAVKVTRAVPGVNSVSSALTVRPIAN
jgi:hyperosmotically inducible periplasmic protein